VAAGVDIVGISSLVTFLENTSPYRRAYREREYGSLAADREFLHEVSPLTRIDQLRAPLFIIHRANDPRVALSEAEQIHAALTARGQECELLVYGNEGHGPAQRSNREDALPKAIAFLPGTWPPDRSLPVARHHHDRAVRVPHNLAADRTHHPTRVWSSWSLSPLQ
jgi:dipeptidyl aminopeptidase/acylaminoacyl peptidase